jgi:hypothetical protein
MQRYVESVCGGGIGEGGEGGSEGGITDAVCADEAEHLAGTRGR